MTEFLNTALKVDIQLLLTAGLKIAQEINLETLVEWQQNLDKFSLVHAGWVTEKEGDVTHVYTRHGLMIVGGAGDNDYDQEALLIVDLGGNDRYRNGAGASRNGHPFSMVIDFSGNDIYMTGEDIPDAEGNGTRRASPAVLPPAEPPEIFPDGSSPPSTTPLRTTRPSTRHTPAVECRNRNVWVKTRPPPRPANKVTVPAPLQWPPWLEKAIPKNQVWFRS